MSLKLRIVILGICLSAPMVAYGQSLPGQAAETRVPGPIEFTKALQLAERGDVESQNLVGLAYRLANGVAGDDAKAAQWFKRAASKGYAPAQYNLAAMYWDGQGVRRDWSEAVHWFQKAAARGYAPAESALGFVYRSGGVVDQDYGKALIWYTKAAGHGDPDGEYYLGLMYEAGQGVKADCASALKWLTEAAAQNLPAAQLRLGGMYETGSCAPRNDKEAARLFQAAAERGNLEAQARLGWFYLMGYGVDQNDALAVQWFTRAAEAGGPNGQFMLGQLYREGRAVNKNNVAAYKWFKLAVAAGIKIDGAEPLKQRMSPEEIAAGEAQVQAWKPTPPSGDNVSLAVRTQNISPGRPPRSAALVGARKARTPTIFNVAVSSITATTATITWDTDVNSDTLVSYDPGGDAWAYDQGMTDCGAATAASAAAAACLGTGAATGTTSHSFTIIGLHPGRTYFFGVRSREFTNRVPDPAKVTHYYADPNNPTCAHGCRFATVAAPSDGSMDYWIEVRGGQHVTQGYSVYGSIYTEYLRGTSSTSLITISFSGVPTNATVQFPAAQLGFCSSPSQGIKSTAFVQGGPFCNDMNFKLNIAPSTPEGTYPMKITFTAKSGIPAPKTVNWPITVDGAMPLASSKPSSYRPIPCLNSASKQMDGTHFCSWNWTSNMLTYGACWGVPGRGCPGGNNENVGPGDEQGAWYYDGERVYFQIHDYDEANKLTGNPSRWNTYALNWENSYAPYVSSNRGALPGFRVFPHGLYMGYQRDGTSSDRTDVNLLATNSAYAGMGAATADPDLSREIAYLAGSIRLAVDLGYTRETNSISTPPNSSLATQEAKAIDLALGHVDQWVVSQTAHNVQPFMLGLTAEALIQYYQDGHAGDVRIPWAIKHMADWLWANAWNQTNGPASWPNAFYYNNRFYKYGVTSFDTRSLNLLICPMYAWLFQYTGDSIYQEEGDRCWQGGVNIDPGGGIGWSGKNFSQNYRWSFDYVHWRSGR